MASPRPKPVALKLLEGRGGNLDSGGRQIKPVPKFERIPPTAPTWLPAEARAEWERVVPELSRLELLKQPDRAALAAYCLSWDRMVAAQKLVDDQGLLSEGPHGPHKNPAVIVLETASKELRSWAIEFGFTPSAESKLAPKESDNGGDADPFD